MFRAFCLLALFNFALSDEEIFPPGTYPFPGPYVGPGFYGPVPRFATPPPGWTRVRVPVRIRYPAPHENNNNVLGAFVELEALHGLLGGGGGFFGGGGGGGGSASANAINQAAASASSSSTAIATIILPPPTVPPPITRPPFGKGPGGGGPGGCRGNRC